MTDPSELSARRDRVIDFKTIATGRISESARIVGFGLLVVYFTLIVSDSTDARALRETHQMALYLVGLFGGPDSDLRLCSIRVRGMVLENHTRQSRCQV